MKQLLCWDYNYEVLTNHVTQVRAEQGIKINVTWLVHPCVCLVWMNNFLKSSATAHFTTAETKLQNRSCSKLLEVRAIYVLPSHQDPAARSLKVDGLIRHWLAIGEAFEASVGGNIP